MTTDYALNFIKNELKFIAKQTIIEKYSIPDSDITDDFEYYKNGELKYRHTFSAITDSVILENLYSNILNVCVSEAPISLLVLKGDNSSNIIRSYNDDYDIRKPNELVMGEEIDIDEPLALASVYETLNFFGATAFSGKAKNILAEYERNLVIPNARYIGDLAFRFSADGTAWHSNYESGDNYFGIYKNGSWGNAIPLISGSGGGAKTLTALSDFPKTHEKGKYLRSNGSKLEWVDISVGSGSGSGSGGTSSGGTANTLELIPDNVEYDNANGIDLSSGSTFKVVNLTSDSAFKIGQNADYTRQIKENVEYKILVKYNGNELSFENMAVLTHDGGDFVAESYRSFCMFNLMKVGDDTLVYNITQGGY